MYKYKWHTYTTKVKDQQNMLAHEIMHQKNCIFNFELKKK